MTKGIICSFVRFVIRGFCRQNCLKLGRKIQLVWEKFEVNFEFNRFQKLPHDEKKQNGRKYVSSPSFFSCNLSFLNLSSFYGNILRSFTENFLMNFFWDFSRNSLINFSKTFLQVPFNLANASRWEHLADVVHGLGEKRSWCTRRVRQSILLQKVSGIPRRVISEIPPSILLRFFHAIV